MTDAGTKKDAFIRNPLGYADSHPPPREWLVEGWQLESFRSDVVYELARSVGKVGSFALAGDWLAWLSPHLEPTRALDLYVKIRDESERLELEWRPEFLAAFPDCPLPPSRDAEVVIGMLREMIENGSGQGFEHLVGTLVLLPVAAEVLDPQEPSSLLSLAKVHRRGVMVSILEEARRRCTGERAC